MRSFLRLTPFLIFFGFLFVSASTTNAATYYLSPSGNDTTGTGTSTAPWFTLQKAWTVIAPGDTVYLKGGTYSYTKQQGLTGKNGTAANPIKIWAAPGETPVITRPASNSAYTTDIYWHHGGIFFTGNYFHFKGIEIKGFLNINETVEIAFIGYNASNNIFEQLVVHDNQNGLYLEAASSSNTILNSDFYNNYDTPAQGGNSDGVTVGYNTGANNVLDGVRAWNNGDDGVDTFEAKGMVTIKNSWAWHNGYVKGTTTPAGDGVGFKLGSNFLQGTALQNTVVRRVQNTISADNRNSGYHINEGDHRAELYNNISYANGVAGLNFHWSNLVHTFKNNVSLGNGGTQVEISNRSISTNNSYGAGYSDGGTGWAQTAATNDFVSVDISQLDNPRNADGSLPTITAFQLTSSSDFINAGTNVGLPYNGSAPDIGVFESGGTTTPPPTSTKFAIGDRVVVTATSLNVRGSASASGTLLGTQVLNALGTVSAGPINADGYAWWNINYDNAPDGWSAETYIEKYTAAPNSAPVVNAGADKTITLPTSSVSLTGSASDPDNNTPLTYAWTKVSGGSATIASPTALTTSITALAQGTYTFRLTVTDSKGLAASDDVNVVVSAVVVVNTPPTANAGADKTVTLPTNSVSLSGSGTDTNGSIASYKWTKVSGGAATISASSSATTNVTGLTQGTYTFRLTVTDNGGLTGSDDVMVTVNPAVVANTPPIANAGADKTITLPTSSVSLTGTASDPDNNTPLTYAWTKVSGGSATIASPTSLTTNITGLTQGTYTFWLTVTDSRGATNADAVMVTVNPAVVVATNTIDMSGAVNYEGYGYYVPKAFGISADNGSNPTRSRLRVFENGTELSPAHASHTEIATVGQGRFSHWIDGTFEALYFSTSNNSNPKTNGRVYTYKTDGTIVTPPPASGFSDNFNRANATALGTSWTERYEASNFRIQSNKLQLNVNDGSIASAHTTSGITSANYKVESKVTLPSTSSIFYAGVSGRRTDYETSDSNGYMVFIEPYDQLLTLYKRVSGEWTRLGEYKISLSAGATATIGLSMQGSTITALWNGTSVISVSDSTFSAAGSAGAITGTGYTTTNITWDDFSITPN